MVRIDIVMTRGGDAGETSLGSGARLRKDASRIEAIGAVDEANAAIGVLRWAGGETRVTGFAQDDQGLWHLLADPVELTPGPVQAAIDAACTGGDIAPPL